MIPHAGEQQEQQHEEHSTTSAATSKSEKHCVGVCDQGECSYGIGGKSYIRKIGVKLIIHSINLSAY